MQTKIQYDFTAWVWQHAAPDGWFFVSLPKEISKEIRQNLQWQEEGWGRMKATAAIGKQEWNTAIWYDKKRETYLLPLKADVRKKAHLKLDEVIAVKIWI